MTRPPAYLRVARWEFLRFFKLRELLVGMAIILAIFLVQKVVSERIAGNAAERSIAVIGGEYLPTSIDQQDRFTFVLAGRGETELVGAVQEKEFDGLLVFAGQDSARLHVRKQAAWQDELQSLLTAAGQDRRVAESGIPAEVLAALGAPFTLDTMVLDSGSRNSAEARWSVAILVGLMLTGVLLGNSYLFLAITGEKTQRITEQIMAAISPQSWIDGKILGLAALALVHLLVYVLGYVLFRVVCVVVWHEALGLPQILADPSLFCASLFLILLGFYFWFCFFGLVACTISDPNSSSRSSMLMLPLLPLGMAFAGLKNPDTFWMKSLSILPFSSPTVMPTRMVLGDVAGWEFLLAAALLGVGIWFLRRAAGTIFGLGMLMYGKEPSLREMWKWLRQGWNANARRRGGAAEV